MLCMLTLSIFLGASETSLSVPEAKPRLVFARDDLEGLRRRVKDRDLRRVWKRILDAAEEYSDPQSLKYADPDKVDQPPDSDAKALTMGHYYGRRLMERLDKLGFAYQITGDHRFGAHGAKYLDAAVRKLPVTDSRIVGGFAGARGDMMRALAVGYDWLGEEMTPDQRAAWAETAAGYVRNILDEVHSEKGWWVPHHNFVGVALGAAGCLSIKLQPFYPRESAEWARECAKLVKMYFDQGYDDQGACYEGTAYADYGLSNAVLFADALRRNGLIDLFESAHLKRVAHFLAMTMLPGETVFDARNDADYAELKHPWLLKLASTYKDSLAAWVWAQSGSGDSPLQIVWASNVEAHSPQDLGEPFSEHFQGRGLCVFRTGWTRDDILFSIEAGPYYSVTHNQGDKGHFALYGLGRRWAIDSGYGNNQEPLGKAQTVAHNCILVDGEGQALSGASWGTNGRIVNYEVSKGYGYVLADSAEAYRINDRGVRGPGLERALRHAIFVRPDGRIPAYVVILDDFRKDNEEHAWTWLLHTAEDNEFELEKGSVTIRAVHTKDSMQKDINHSITRVWLGSDSPSEFRIDKYEGHPRLNLTTRAVEPGFAAVLVPLSSNIKAPRVEIRPSPGETIVRIHWPSRIDTVHWPRQGLVKPEIGMAARNK